MKPSFTATRLRLTLSFSLFVIALLATILFYFVDSKLQEVAKDVSHSVADASASQNNLQTLQQLQKQLSNNKDIVDRASSIVADSQSYQYQDQILTDLNDYASRAGISITNIDFSSNTVAGSTGTPSPTTKQPATAAPTPTGVKSTSVAITLNNPVVYNNLLRFIKSLEQNLTKMQISKVSLSKGAAGNNVSSEILTIQVYIR